MRKDKQRRPLVLRMLYWLLILVTVASQAALILGYCASWISPQSVGWIALFGLGLQFLMMWNLLLFFVWLVVLKWWALLIGVTLLGGIGFVGDFVQFSWVKHYHQEDDYGKTPQITIASYNVHSFGETTEPHKAKEIKDSILENLKLYKPDIICFQEYAVNLYRDTSKYDNLYADYPHRQWLITADWRYVKIGLEVRSRFPLRLVTERVFEASENAMQVIDVTVSRGNIVRLLNCHLQSTGFNSVSPEGLMSMVENHDTLLMRNALVTMNENYKRRAVQADTIAAFVEQSPHTVVVAGDFNDTPSSYVVSTVGANLKDGFRKVGRGYGSSYRKMRGLFRIDYVLYDGDSLKAVRYDSPNLQWSDHRPVITKLIFKNR